MRARSAPRPPRCRCGPAGREGLRGAGQGKGDGPGGDRAASRRARRWWASCTRSWRTSWAARTPRSLRDPAAGGDPARGPAGLGQDHRARASSRASSATRRRRRCCSSPPTSTDPPPSTSSPRSRRRSSVEMYPVGSFAEARGHRARRLDCAKRHFYDVLIVDTAGGSRSTRR